MAVKAESGMLSKEFLCHFSEIVVAIVTTTGHLIAVAAILATIQIILAAAVHLAEVPFSARAYALV